MQNEKENNYEELFTKVHEYRTISNSISKKILNGKYGGEWEQLKSDISGLLFEFFIQDMRRNVPEGKKEEYLAYLTEMVNAAKKEYQAVCNFMPDAECRKRLLKLKEQLLKKEAEYCDSLQEEGQAQTA